MTWSLLIVEDEPEIREALGDVLLARGFKVLLARDGQDAIAVTRRTQSRPSVIVLDLVMPEMDGRSFLEHQQRDPLLRDVPVVVVTALEPPPADLPKPVTAVFRKPIPLAAFLEEIRRIVGATAWPTPRPSY